MRKKLRPLSVNDFYKLSQTIDYQFGSNVSKILLGDINNIHKLRVYKSPNTLRIREVYRDNKPIFTIRAEDYKILLRIHGAYLLWKNTEEPYYRVTIINDVAEYIVDGRNVFSRHVLQIDENRRCGDEVIVVDEEGNLLAVGTLKLSPEEILFFTRGEAVRIRETIRDLESE